MVLGNGVKLLRTGFVTVTWENNLIKDIEWTSSRRGHFEQFRLCWLGRNSKACKGYLYHPLLSWHLGTDPVPDLSPGCSSLIKLLMDNYYLTLSKVSGFKLSKTTLRIVSFCYKENVLVKSVCKKTCNR